MSPTWHIDPFNSEDDSKFTWFNLLFFGPSSLPGARPLHTTSWLPPLFLTSPSTSSHDLANLFINPSLTPQQHTPSEINYFCPKSNFYFQIITYQIFTYRFPIIYILPRNEYHVTMYQYNVRISLIEHDSIERDSNRTGCVCMCGSLCVGVCLCVSVCEWVSMCLGRSMYAWPRIYVCICMYVSECMYVCQWGCMYVSVCLSVSACVWEIVSQWEAWSVCWVWLPLKGSLTLPFSQLHIALKIPAITNLWIIKTHSLINGIRSPSFPISRLSNLFQTTHNSPDHKTAPHHSTTSYLPHLGITPVPSSSAHYSMPSSTRPS